MRSRQVVVFEPHNDDMIIGMGGTVLQLLADEWEVTSVVMADGRYGSTEMSPEETARVRAEEKKQEVKELGVSLHSLGLEDTTLPAAHEDEGTRTEVVSDILNEIGNLRDPVVFIPASTEGHPDHRATRRFALDAKEAVGDDWTVAEYLVWEVPFLCPIDVEVGIILRVDIDEQIEDKKACVRIHESQERERAYSEFAASFNRYLSKLYYEDGGPKFSEVINFPNVEDVPGSMADSLTCKDVTDWFHSNAD